MTFEERRFKDLTDNGLGTSEFELLAYELGRKASRQETLREVKSDIQGLRNILDHGETDIFTTLSIKVNLILKKLEAEREG